MGDKSISVTGHTQRAQTNESLQVERDEADAAFETKTRAIEADADAVVKVARERADQVLQLARDDAQEALASTPLALEPVESEHSSADLLLTEERAVADALLEHERRERRRYMADFLVSEREATDNDLTIERAHADTVIATRDEFLATVSHDLRSLLGGLALNGANLVRHADEGAAGEKVRRYAESSQRMVARMNRLVNDLLDMASIEAGKLAVYPERTDVHQLLKETFEAFEPIASAKGVTLKAETPTAHVYAMIDGERILQVLGNLVSNAIKFTAAKGTVTIFIRATEAQLEAGVRDDGVGIPESLLEGVFERFRQVSKDRRGLGLGLHISKSIVELHGGKMWAERNVGAGTTFRFVIPTSAVFHR